MRLPPLPPAWQELAARTDLRVPDQSRYGPGSIPVNGQPHERDGLLLYAQEAGGTTVTCACGWERWSQTKSQTQDWGREHAAPKKKGEGVTYDCPTLRKMEKSDEHR